MPYPVEVEDKKKSTQSNIYFTFSRYKLEAVKLRRISENPHISQCCSKQVKPDCKYINRYFNLLWLVERKLKVAELVL